MREIARGAQILLDAAKRDRCVLVCGNGGSAADSQHFAAEWIGRYKSERRPLRALSLAGDAPTLTALGNDYGFKKIFARGVEAHGVPGDVLLAISTSGKSPNVLNALSAARKRRMRSIFLTGAATSHPRADCVVSVPSKETARIQEMHVLIYHAWCEYVDANLS